MAKETPRATIQMERRAILRYLDGPIVENDQSAARPTSIAEMLLNMSKESNEESN